MDVVWTLGYQKLWNIEHAYTYHFYCHIVVQESRVSQNSLFVGVEEVMPNNKRRKDRDLRKESLICREWV